MGTTKYRAFALLGAPALLLAGAGARADGPQQPLPPSSFSLKLTKKDKPLVRPSQGGENAFAQDVRRAMQTPARLSGPSHAPEPRLPLNKTVGENWAFVPDVFLNWAGTLLALPDNCKAFNEALRVEINRTPAGVKRGFDVRMDEDGFGFGIPTRFRALSPLRKGPEFWPAGPPVPLSLRDRAPPPTTSAGHICVYSGGWWPGSCDRFELPRASPSAVPARLFPLSPLPPTGGSVRSSAAPGARTYPSLSAPLSGPGLRRSVGNYPSLGVDTTLFSSNAPPRSAPKGKSPR